MADIKTFTSFKDWLLIIMTGATLALVGNTWYNVNYLMIQDALRSSKEAENERWKAEIKQEISSLRSDQQSTRGELNAVKEFIKPTEIRPRKYSSR